MTHEQEIRVHLNELHTTITDVLERIDEHAYRDAYATLDQMQSEIGSLRQDVTALESELSPV